jgi:hypothetical protein
MDGEAAGVAEPVRGLPGMAPRHAAVALAAVTDRDATPVCQIHARSTREKYSVPQRLGVS